MAKRAQPPANIIESIRLELEILREQREEIDAKMARLTESLADLIPIYEGGPAASANGHRAKGMTGSIRHVLKSHPRPLSAVEVRDYLEAAGFQLDGYSNVMATIHQVLRRLVLNDEAQPVPTSSGKTLYEWNPPSDSA